MTTSNHLYSEAKKQRKLAKNLNITAAIIGLWAAFSHSPYELSMWANLLLPILLLMLMWWRRNIFSVDITKRAPSLNIAFFFTAMGAFVGAGVSQYSMNWLEPLTISAIVAIPFAIAAIMPSSDFKFAKRGHLIFLSILAWLISTIYAYGFYTFLNSRYDKSDPVVYKAAVISKRINTRKSDSYYLTIGPWQRNSKSDELDVTKSDYEYFNPGDSVNILVYQGFLGSEWFSFDELPQPLPGPVYGSNSDSMNDIDTIEVIQKVDSVFITE